MLPLCASLLAHLMKPFSVIKKDQLKAMHPKLMHVKKISDGDGDMLICKP